jgi:stage II sporulation protein R
MFFLQNIICNRKVKYSILLLILLIFFIFVNAFSYVNAVSNNLSESVFRLHIIANSDSEEDQELKLKVRNSVLEYMNDICKDATTKSEAIEIANSHLDDFEQIALSVIYENGYNYSVSVKIGNFAFPTKTYGDISLPSGYYDALRIEIGEAKGQNWWCVMFPPLCFVDVSSGIVPDESKETMKNNLSDEEFSLISNTDDTDIHFKFKLIELFQNVRINLAKSTQ